MGLEATPAAKAIRQGRREPPPQMRWQTMQRNSRLARRIASDLLADLGHVETTLLKPDGKILYSTARPGSPRENRTLDARCGPAHR